MSTQDDQVHREARTEALIEIAESLAAIRTNLQYPVLTSGISGEHHSSADISVGSKGNIQISVKAYAQDTPEQWNDVIERAKQGFTDLLAYAREQRPGTGGLA